MMHRALIFLLLALGLPQTAAAATKAALDVSVKRQALAVVACAQAAGVGERARTVTVIDYGRPSLAPRLWIVDIATGAVEAEEHVAHGKNSGDNMTTKFSNTMDSLQSSLGLFVTGETYVGENGYSLRLDGLVPGVNDRARDRAIVMHGAAYVDPAAGAKQGRLGRSWGCPALRSAVARGLIDTIKGGNFVYAHHPRTDWVSASPFGNCAAMAKRNVGGARAAR